MTEKDRELLFAGKLNEIKALKASGKKTISEADIHDMFSELELSAAHMELVYDYLKKQGISVSLTADGDAPLLTGERDELDRFLMGFLGNIEDMARIYRGQGVLHEDLVGEGNLAVYEACMGLTGPGSADEEEALGAYLARCAMLAMERSVGEHAEIKDGESKLLSRVKKVGEAASEISELLRRKISVEELLLENEEFTEEEVRNAIRLSGGSIDVSD